MTAVDPGRAKTITLLAGIVVAGLIIVAWTQPWFDVAVAADSAARATKGGLEVGGDVAAGGLAGLGLAGLALIGALSIAGRVFRLVLGVLQVLIGATVTLSGVVALADPVSAVAPAVTAATGESGRASVGQLVESVTAGFWPSAAVVLGISAVVLGVVVISTSGRWPGSARKYQAVRFEPDGRTPEDVAPTAELDASDPPQGEAPGGDAVADWDALSDGADPTSR